MAKRPRSRQSKAQRRDDRGRFVAGYQKPGRKKKRAAVKPKPKAKVSRKKRKRLSTGALMRAIVNRYESDGIGIAEYPEVIDDRQLRGDEIWHWYYVLFEEAFTIEDIAMLSDYFAAVLLRRYRYGCIIRVQIGVENENGMAGAWRTLVATQEARASFSQVPNHAEAWLRGSDYTVVTGFGVDIRAPKYYERGQA